jgi:hypothetical protein
MPQAPPPGNRELQELIWGAYKQVQRLRSQWPPAEPRGTLPVLGAADQRAGARLLESIQERLQSVQRDLETLQRVAQEELRAAEAQSSSTPPPGLSIGSSAELFEAVRLGILDKAEARRLLGLVGREGGGARGEGAQAAPDQPPSEREPTL